MSVALTAIGCFLQVLIYSLAPASIGFALGWICREEKYKKDKEERLI